MDPYFLPYVRAYELLIGALFAFYSALAKQRPLQHAFGRLGDDGGDCRHVTASLRRVAR